MTLDSASENRYIRVFISSTFRDMHAERDQLVKFVFPQLRRLCEARAVTWGEVDLRWGVTDEAAAEGKVLPVCLEEINRCRPYFIGLLGERYGWVPQAIPDELIEREEWLRGEFREHKSVTELEILYGVLRNPAMAGHAYFYFRDADYVNSVPEQDRKDFVSEDAGDRAKLENLKERIRTSGLPVREGYRDPKALGELVLADLTAVIDKRWPKGSEPDPLTSEALDHAAYARSRERVYIGRPEYFARLDAHATGGGDQPLVILGESGSGKSALLANWARRYRKSHPDVFVLEHYIGATPHSAEWAAMLRRIMGEFKNWLGFAQDIPDQQDALRSTFSNWLYMAAAKGRVVLILDALNQLEDRDGAPDLVWLPPVMPENVRLIVSTLPGRPLDEITKRAWPVLKVESLTLGERKELIREFLGEYGRSLSPARMDRIAAVPQAANPLYLRVLLDELRLFGRHEFLEERISYYLQAASPYELYGKVMTRWEQDYGHGTRLVGDTLSLLWAARRGLTESELLEALGSDGQPLPRAKWSPLFLAMADALVSRNGLLTFAHDFLRSAARDAYLPKEGHRQQVHIRLGDYFGRQASGPRRTDEFPWQLSEARAWKRLYDLLAGQEFFKDAWDRNEFEVKTYWAQIEAGSELRMVEAYRKYIEHPESDIDKLFLWRLSRLLTNTGHLDGAFLLRSALVEHFEKKGDLYSLQIMLGDKGNILYERGDLDGAMALYKEQERICRDGGYLFNLEEALGNQGNILDARGNLDGAMALYREQEAICRKFRKLDHLVGALCNQANILFKRGDLDGAMALYKEQERTCRQLGEPDGLGLSLGNQAVILYERGDLDGAMALHKEEERICRQLSNLAGLHSSLGNQGKILEKSGKFDGAMALYKEKEQICRQLGNLAGLQSSLTKQSNILWARGDLDGAMALYKEQERICRQLGNLAGLGSSLGGQGNILFARGDLDGAMALYKEKERICRQLDDLGGLEETLGNQGNILDARGDLDGAMALYKQQERICRQLGNLDDLASAIGRQGGTILRARGNLSEALVLLKEAERLFRQIGNLAALQTILCNQGAILDADYDLDGALLLYKEAESICRQLGIREGLAYVLANQALALQKKGCASEGLPLAEEAYRLATSHGYAALAGQIAPILKNLRRAAGK